MNNWLSRFWYDASRTPPIWALLLERLFLWLAAKRKRKLCAADRWTSPVPVVVIGNISVGGTGKTPLAVWLIELLRQHGYTPGVISRGYGGQGPFPLAVELTTAASVCGDEPAMLVRRCQVPLVVSPDRVGAAKLLLQQSPQVDILISDDGLQHYALQRDMEIVVVDGVRGFGNGHCLPAGPLRERIERLEQVDFVVQNGGELAPWAHSLYQLKPEALRRLDGRPTGIEPSKAFNAFAGIGHPARFFQSLRDQGFELKSCTEFDDHHSYQASELPEHPRICTEKDAVKLVDIGVTEGYYLPVAVKFTDGFADRFIERLHEILRER